MFGAHDDAGHQSSLPLSCVKWLVSFAVIAVFWACMCAQCTDIVASPQAGLLNHQCQHGRQMLAEIELLVSLQASDVYALGVLVWEMYNGQRAWSGLHFAQLSYAMFVEKRMLQFPEGTPEGLKSLASRCLARAPTDRPSSQELPALLKDLISDSQQWKHCNSL